MAARAASGELSFEATTIRGVTARATDRPDADLRAIGPTRQRYLTGDLGGAEPRA